MSVQNLLQTLNPTPLNNGMKASTKIEGENVKELAELLGRQSGEVSGDFSNLLQTILGKNLDEAQQKVLLENIEKGVSPEDALKMVEQLQPEQLENTSKKSFPLQIGVAGLSKDSKLQKNLLMAINENKDQLSPAVDEGADAPQTKESTAKKTGLFAGLKISSTKLPNRLNQTSSQNIVDGSSKELSTKMGETHKVGKHQISSGDDQLLLLQNRAVKGGAKVHAAYQIHGNQDSNLIKMNHTGKELKGNNENSLAKIVAHSESKASVKDPMQAVMSKEHVQGDNLLQHSDNGVLHMMKNSVQHDHVVQSTKPLQNIETASNQELINKISDYIEQNSVVKNNSLNLTVHHKQLGQFDIAVSQNRQTNALDVMINSATQEGTQFFQANEHKLMSKLQTAGFELNDFKVVSRMAQVDAGRNSGDSMFNNNSSSNSRGWSSHQQGSHQENADGQRRRELWEEYKERYYA